MKTAFLFLSFFSIFNIWSQNHCQKGQDSYEAKNYNAAIEALQLCLKNNPENEDAQYHLARSYAELQQWEKAVDVYKILVEANPENAEYNFLYGGSLGLYAKRLSPLKAVGYISDIKYYLKKAIQLDSKHIDARWALVQIFMELPFVAGGSKSTAEDYADELLSISPVDGHLAYGFIEVYDKNWAKAEKHYKKAVKVGQSETSYQKLVDVQIQQKKMEEVKVTLREAYRVTQKEHFKKLLDKI